MKEYVCVPCIRSLVVIPKNSFGGFFVPSQNFVYSFCLHCLIATLGNSLYLIEQQGIQKRTKIPGSNIPCLLSILRTTYNLQLTWKKNI